MYGSPEFSAVDPTLKKHDQLEIKSARLPSDKKTVLLEVADFKPVHQIKLKLRLQAADGTSIQQELYGTIHKTHAAAVASVK